MTTTRTYFTFPDGALGYDCARCGQKCCRGRGFAFGGDELVPLLARAPRLAPLLRLRPGGSVYAVDVSDGCWFLAGDGNCSLEVEHGRAAKPSTCRLFPFNRVFRVGEVRVVDFNANLCPLEAAVVGAGGVRHAELAAELDGLAGSPLIDVPAALPDGLPDDWDAREAAIVARGCAAEARAAWFGDGEAARLWAAWSALYGLPPASDAHRDAVTRAAGLLLGSVRWGWLFRRDGAGDYAARAGELPRRLLAWLFLAEAAPPSVKPSLRALVELWHEAAWAIDVLAAWDAPVSRPTQFTSDVPAPLEPVLGAFFGAVFRGGTLGEALTRAAAGVAPPLRALLVAVASDQRRLFVGGA